MGFILNRDIAREKMVSLGLKLLGGRSESSLGIIWLCTSIELPRSQGLPENVSNTSVSQEAGGSRTNRIYCRTLAERPTVSENHGRTLLTGARLR